MEIKQHEQPRHRGRPRGPKKINVCLKLTPEAYECAQKYAYRSNRSVSQVVNDWMSDLRLPAESAGKPATA